MNYNKVREYSYVYIGTIFYVLTSNIKVNLNTKS